MMTEIESDRELATIERLRREYRRALDEARELGARLARTWLDREQVAWREVAIWARKQEGQRVIDLPRSMRADLKALCLAHPWLDEDDCMDILYDGFAGTIGEILLGVVCNDATDKATSSNV